MSRQFNGRVDIKSPDTAALFQMYDKIPANQCATYRNPTEGQWENSLLSSTFFSAGNMQIIQNGIRAGVYDKSNGQFVIDNQDCDALKIIMRGIFLEHALNQPDHIREQVEQLSNFVLNYSIPRVYSEAIGYNKYLEDVSTMYTPMDRPVMSKTNDKQLEMKPWF